VGVRENANEIPGDAANWTPIMATSTRTVRPATRSRRKGEARRIEILGIAKDLLLVGGPDAVVLRDVADRLGITHSNVQYYFRTRHDLLVAIYDEEIQKFMGSVGPADEGAQGPEDLRRLDAIVDAGLRLVRAPDTALWRLMVGMLDHSSEMAALHLKECRRYENRLVLELGVILPGLSLARRRAMAIIMQAVIDGMSIRAVHEPRTGVPTELVDREIKRAIRSLADGGPPRKRSRTARVR
jgi:AcrR family transcriptional regulator